MLSDRYIQEMKILVESKLQIVRSFLIKPVFVGEPGGHQYLYMPKGSFPGGSDSTESACNSGDMGLIPGLGRFPGIGNGNPLQYFCLENSMDRESWWATLHGVAKSWTGLSD